MTNPSETIATISVSDEALRAVAVIASSNLYAQPHLAAMASPTNVLLVADTFFKYIQGESSGLNQSVQKASEELTYA